MYNPGLTKAYLATTDAAPYTIAKYVTGDHTVAAATAPADRICGVFTEAGAKSGRNADVVRSDMPGVLLGGAVAVGDRLTSNANGRAVVAASGNSLLGTAVKAGVAGDVIPVHLLIGATA